MVVQRTLGNMSRDRMIVWPQKHRGVKALGRLEYVIDRSRKASCVVSVIHHVKPNKHCDSHWYVASPAKRGTRQL